MCTPQQPIVVKAEPMPSGSYGTAGMAAHYTGAPFNPQLRHNLPAEAAGLSGEFSTIYYGGAGACEQQQAPVPCASSPCCCRPSGVVGGMPQYRDVGVNVLAGSPLGLAGASCTAGSQMAMPMNPGTISQHNNVAAMRPDSHYSAVSTFNSSSPFEDGPFGAFGAVAAASGTRHSTPAHRAASLPTHISSPCDPSGMPTTPPAACHCAVSNNFPVPALSSLQGGSQLPPASPHTGAATPTATAASDQAACTPPDRTPGCRPGESAALSQIRHSVEKVASSLRSKTSTIPEGFPTPQAD